jgi:hypothetical protein
MNLLIFVVSLLMLLSLMTYSRLDMYRNFYVTQGEFERYMKQEERQSINRGEELWYNWTEVKEKENTKPPKKAPSQASPYLSIYWVINSDKIDQKESLESVYKELIKKLIFNVFGNQKKFITIFEQNPHVIDDLFNALQAAYSKIPKEKKPKKIDELLNLDLDNPQLEDLFYWMSKGISPSKNLPESDTALILERVVEKGDKEVLPSTENIEDHYITPGVIKLQDFLTINSSKNKIRIFLAPREVLLTIFNDTALVEDLERTRLEMYVQAKNEADTSTLSEQFKQKFYARAVQVPESMLDFTVTKTDPRQYEISTY